jgi:hypothetical protein
MNARCEHKTEKHMLQRNGNFTVKVGILLLSV